MSKVRRSLRARAKQFTIGKNTGFGSDLKQLRRKFEQQREYFEER